MLVVYLTAYVALSRRGRAEAIRYRTEGLYYLPLDTYSDANKRSWQFQEHALTILFWPVNRIESWFNPAMDHGGHAFCEIDVSSP